MCRCLYFCTFLAKQFLFVVLALVNSYSKLCMPNCYSGRGDAGKCTQLSCHGVPA